MGLNIIPRALEICLRGRWCLLKVCGCGSVFREYIGISWLEICLLVITKVGDVQLRL